MEAENAVCSPIQQSAVGSTLSMVTINNDRSYVVHTDKRLPQPVSAVHESSVSFASNGYLHSISDNSKIRQRKIVSRAPKAFYECFGIWNSEHHRESLQTAQSNSSNPTDLDVRLTQYDARIADSYVGYIKDNASADQRMVRTQYDLTFPFPESQLPVASDLNNATVTNVTPTHGFHDTAEAIAQALQVCDSEIQDTVGTKKTVSANFGSSLPAKGAANNPFQSIQMSVPEGQGKCRSNNVLKSTQHRHLLHTESNLNGAWDEEMSAEQQRQSEKYIFHDPAHLDKSSSEEHTMSVTKELLVSAVQESKPMERNLNNSSVHGLSRVEETVNIPGVYELVQKVAQIYASEKPSCPLDIREERKVPVENNHNSPCVHKVCPIQQEEHVPGLRETHAQAAQIFRNQGMSGTPQVRTTDRKTNAIGSYAENCPRKNVVFKMCVCSNPNKYTRTANDRSDAGSKVCNSRYYSVNGGSGNHSGTRNPGMFSSCPVIFDTDDLTERDESSSTIMSLVDLYSDRLKYLEHNQSEDYVVSMIKNYMFIASAMMGTLHLVAARIFTSPAIYDINWTTLYMTVADEIDFYDVCRCYKQRLLAIKSYIKTTCESTAEVVIAETVRQELMEEKRMTDAVHSSFRGDHSAYSRQIVSRLQETGSSAEGALLFSNGVRRVGVTPAPYRTSDRTQGRGIGERKEVHTGTHKYVKGETLQRAAMLQIYSIAEKRVCRIRHINSVMLHCFKIVLHILGLGLQAKRLAQRAITETMKRQVPGTDHVVAFVVELVTTAANWAHTALQNVEEAVRLHEAVVGALMEAERSLHKLGVQARCGGGEFLDVIAYVDVVEEAVHRTCDIFLDKPGGDAMVTSGAPQPPSQTAAKSDLPTPKRSDRGPRDVFEALFWATQDSIGTIDHTLHGLQDLSHSLLFSTPSYGFTPS